MSWRQECTIGQWGPSRRMRPSSETSLSSITPYLWSRVKRSYGWASSISCDPTISSKRSKTNTRRWCLAKIPLWSSQPNTRRGSWVPWSDTSSRYQLLSDWFVLFFIGLGKYVKVKARRNRTWITRSGRSGILPLYYALVSTKQRGKIIFSYPYEFKG